MSLCRFLQNRWECIRKIMNKILVITGIIVFITLILSAVIFIGGFGNFAKNLGDKSKNINLDEKTYFIGTWSSDTNQISFLSDGTFTTPTDQGAYQIKNNQVVLTYNYYGTTEKYDYSFSDEKTTLYLTKNSQTDIYDKE